MKIKLKSIYINITCNIYYNAQANRLSVFSKAMYTEISMQMFIEALFINSPNWK